MKEQCSLASSMHISDRRAVSHAFIPSPHSAMGLDYRQISYNMNAKWNWA